MTGQLPHRCGFRTLRELELACIEVADHTTNAYLLRWRCPLGAERADLQGEARLAAWKASLAYDPTRGASWRTYVVLRVGHALQETSRSRAMGGRNRGIAQIAWVPLDEADPFIDPRAASDFNAAEARALALNLRALLPAQQWADLAGTILAGSTYAEYAAVIGRTESRVQQRVSKALAAARGEVAL